MRRCLLFVLRKEMLLLSGTRQNHFTTLAVLLAQVYKLTRWFQIFPFVGVTAVQFCIGCPDRVPLGTDVFTFSVGLTVANDEARDKTVKTVHKRDSSYTLCPFFKLASTLSVYLLSNTKKSLGLIHQSTYEQVFGVNHSYKQKVNVNFEEKKRAHFSYMCLHVCLFVLWSLYQKHMLMLVH